jgi:hypothetical protein
MSGRPCGRLLTQKTLCLGRWAIPVDLGVLRPTVLSEQPRGRPEPFHKVSTGVGWSLVGKICAILCGNRCFPVGKKKLFSGALRKFCPYRHPHVDRRADPRARVVTPRHRKRSWCCRGPLHDGSIAWPAACSGPVSGFGGGRPGLPYGRAGKSGGRLPGCARPRCRVQTRFPAALRRWAWLRSARACRRAGGRVWGDDGRPQGFGAGWHDRETMPATPAAVPSDSVGLGDGVCALPAQEDARKGHLRLVDEAGHGV